MGIRKKNLIFEETDKIVTKVKKPRNGYINDAIDYCNRLQKHSILEKKLKKESDLVQSNSMDILVNLDSAT